MKEIIILLTLAFILMGCNEDKKETKPLSDFTCEDSRIGRSKEELVAIGEACFRKGQFVKSSGKEW